MCPSEDFYCPICGKREFSVVTGEHHCTDDEIAAEFLRRKSLDVVTPEDPPYGEQIEDGFGATNPYGDCYY